MVATYFDSFDASSRFLVRPNCSLPWRHVVRFYLGVVTVSLTIAIGFALKGAWMILPFAGLEMLVLGAALYVVAHRAAQWQTISIRGDSIVVEKHGSKQEQFETFQCAWAQVELEPATIKGHPARLVIRSHGRATEVGACLNEKEKKQLAEDLRQAVNRHR